MKLLRGIPEYVRVHRGSFWQNKLLWHEKTNKQTNRLCPGVAAAAARGTKR